MSRNTVIIAAAAASAVLLCGCGPNEVEIRPESEMMQNVVSETEAEIVTEAAASEAVTLPQTEVSETEKAETSVSETTVGEKQEKKEQTGGNSGSSGNSGSGNSGSGNSGGGQTAENRTSDNSRSQDSQTQGNASPAETPKQEEKPSPSPSPEPSPVQETEPAPEVQNVELKYVDGILIVNKSYPVPEDYEPSGLVLAYGSWEDYLLPETNEAFKQMALDAANEGLNLYCSSGYRSYATQKRLYNNYVYRDGKDAADTYSARPGHSEHHTGLCFDLNTIDSSFAYTAEGKWVAENSWKYGLIVRYPQSKEDITGYKYEPWHLRYVGTDLAKTLYESGQCLEEYFGLTSCYSD